MSKKQRAKKQRAVRLAASAASSPASSTRATPSPAVPRVDMRARHSPSAESPSAAAASPRAVEEDTVSHAVVPTDGEEVSSSSHKTSDIDVRATASPDSKPDALTLPSTMSLSEETPGAVSELESSQEIDEAFNEWWDAGDGESDSEAQAEASVDEAAEPAESSDEPKAKEPAVQEANAQTLASHPQVMPKGQHSEEPAEGATEIEVATAPLGDPAALEREAKEPDVLPEFEAKKASVEQLATRKMAKPKSRNKKGPVGTSQGSGSTLKSDQGTPPDSPVQPTSSSDPARFMSTGFGKQWSSSSISGQFNFGVPSAKPFKSPLSTTQMGPVPGSPLRSSITPDTAEGPRLGVFGQPLTGALSEWFTFEPSQGPKDEDSPSPRSRPVGQPSAVAPSFLFAPSSLLSDAPEMPAQTSLAKEPSVPDIATPTPDCATQVSDSAVLGSDAVLPGPNSAPPVADSAIPAEDSVIFVPDSAMAYRTDGILPSPPESPEISTLLSVESPEPLRLSTSSVDNDSLEILSVMEPLKRLSISEPETELEPLSGLDGRSGEASDPFIQEQLEDGSGVRSNDSRRTSSTTDTTSTKEREYTQMLEFGRSQGGPSLVDDYETELMRDLRGSVSPEREQASEGDQPSDDEQGPGKDKEPVEESNSEGELEPDENQKWSAKTTADLYEPSTAQPRQFDEEAQISQPIKKGLKEADVPRAERSEPFSPVPTRGPPKIPQAGVPSAGFIFNNPEDIAAELSIKTSISSSRQALQLGDWDQALLYAEKAVESSRRFDFEPLVQRSRFWEGVALYKSYDYDGALLAFQEAKHCEGIYEEGGAAKSFVPKAMIKSSIAWSKRRDFKGPSIFVKTATDDNGQGISVTRDEEFNMFRHTSYFEWDLKITADRQKVRSRTEYLTAGEPISAEEALEYLTDAEASSLKEQLQKAKRPQKAKATRKQTLGRSLGTSTRSQAETNAIKLRMALFRLANKRSPNDAELFDIYATSEQTRNGRLLAKPIIGEVAEGSLSQAHEQGQRSQDGGGMPSVRSGKTAAGFAKGIEASETTELELRDSKEDETNALKARVVAEQSKAVAKTAKDAGTDSHEEARPEPKRSLWGSMWTRLFGDRERRDERVRSTS